jgi:hypothetical protein
MWRRELGEDRTTETRSSDVAMARKSFAEQIGQFIAKAHRISQRTNRVLRRYAPDC